MKKLITLALIATVAAIGNLSIDVNAADKPAPAEKAERKGAKHIPFHGKIDSIDKAAKLLKVGERTFHVTASTKVIKAGKPATLEDASKGDEVGGAYLQGEGGKLELMSLRIGPKPAKEEKQ